MSEKKTQVLIADTAAFIKSGIRLDSLAEEVVTIAEVVREVRDYNARANLALAVALSDVKVRVPSDESVAAVAAFARKTGDFSVLSSTDLRVLALTYMLEKERNGIAHLRTEPMKPQQFAPKKPRVKTTDTASVAATEGTDASTSHQPIEQEAEESRLDLSEQNVEYVDEEGEDDQLEEAAATIPAPPSEEVAETTKSSVEVGPGYTVDDEDDGGEWITPANIAKIKAKHEQKVQSQLASQKRIAVGCLTTDFAMQNVLLQMNLTLVSVDGIQIKKAKSWIMRCHACYKTTTDMSKVFCPACGGNTLMRTSCSIDGNGKLTFYLKRNFQYNLRGTKFSIPTPKGGQAGKAGADMILREDQKEFTAGLRAAKSAQKKADYLDLDFVHFSETNGKRGGGIGGPVIGHGRKNPNSGKGRRRKSGVPVSLVGRFAGGSTTTEAQIQTSRTGKETLTSTHELIPPSSIPPDADLLVCTPAHAAEAALQPFINNEQPFRNTNKRVIILLVNGVLALHKRLLVPGKNHHLILGSTTHGVFRTKPYTITHAGMGETVFGCPPETDSSHPRVESVLHALNQMHDLNVTAPLEWEVLHRKLLLKLVVNCALNPVTAIMNCRNGSVSNSEHGRALLKQLCAEIAQLPDFSSGLEMSADDLLGYVLAVSNATANNVNSMDAAVSKGLEPEIDFLNGDVLERAAKSGISLPTHEAIVDLVRLRLQLNRAALNGSIS
ncbi:Nin1 binding protein [Chytriomyces hyalinus]|nr:Nin1 binding protein [Chytriomyces hyalinus]